MMQRSELEPGFDAALRGTILRIRDKYFLWSSIADAPLTIGMHRAEFMEWYRANIDGPELRAHGGMAGLFTLDARIQRAAVGGEFGTSSFDGSAESTIAVNRAGPDETRLTVEEIYNLTA